MAARVVMASRPFRTGIALAVLVTAIAGCAGTPIGGPRAPRDDPDAGLLVLGSGRAAPVYPAELRYSGNAEYRWPDGRVYAGEWLDGVPHGQGSETRPDGETYSGAWQHGLRHGLGELLAVGGGLYQGEFHDGIRQGKGVQFSDEGIYQGEWRADREHGHGELAGVYGSHYTGEWREGLRSGQGAHRGADGSSYQGEWRDDQPDGFGIFRSADGAVYEGEWRKGRQHGAGRLQAASGVTFEGNWDAAQRSGFGIEQRPDGSQYAGEWQADKRYGQGRETWADGSFHDGIWELNQALGPGHRRYITGIEIHGVFTGNSVSSGLLSLPGGVEYAGPLFRNGNSRASPMLQQWLESTGAAGNPHAQLLAATLYLDYAEPAPDPAQARAWLEPAAQAGIPEAAFRLAVLLLEHGDAEEQAPALRWLEQAADSGHGEAHRVLGDLHAAGSDKPADDKRAISHYTHALRSGSPLAAERLARLLATTTAPGLRDPAGAVAVIEWQALHEQYWRQLDTLALAYAANGDQTSAALAQERAIQAARPTPGAVAAGPAVRPGTPALAASALINPPPVMPDPAAMRQRLERYRDASTGAQP